MPKTNGSTHTIEQLAATVVQLADHTRHLAEQTAKLEADLKLARGTREIVTKPSTEYSSREPDDVSTSALYERVLKMITGRPMTYRAILDETQAQENRIRGIMVRLQRDGHGVVNLGNGRRAIYFVPTAAQRAKLLNRR
jgi:hypothetical protein